MKAQPILIASALVLMSNFASAQEPGAQEEEAPSAKMTGEDTMGHMGRGMMDHGTTCYGDHGVMGRRMMGRGMSMRIIFALMDTDGDGTLSVEEFQTAHAKIFKVIDVNKDGKVTPEEMEMFFRGGSPTSNP
jgi:EF hand domain-containing protein